MYIIIIIYIIIYNNIIYIIFVEQLHGGNFSSTSVVLLKKIYEIVEWVVLYFGNVYDNVNYSSIRYFVLRSFTTMK